MSNSNEDSCKKNDEVDIVDEDTIRIKGMYLSIAWYGGDMNN